MLKLTWVIQLSDPVDFKSMEEEIIIFFTITTITAIYLQYPAFIRTVYHLKIRIMFFLLLVIVLNYVIFLINNQ